MNSEYNKETKFNRGELIKNDINTIVTAHHNEPSVLPPKILKLAEESLPKLADLLSEKEWIICKLETRYIM